MNAVARMKTRRFRRLADRWERFPRTMTTLWLALVAAGAMQRYRVLRDLLAARKAVRADEAAAARVEDRFTAAMADLRGNAPARYRRAGDLFREAMADRLVAREQPEMEPVPAPSEDGQVLVRVNGEYRRITPPDAELIDRMVSEDEARRRYREAVEGGQADPTSATVPPEPAPLRPIPDVVRRTIRPVLGVDHRAAANAEEVDDA